MWKIATKQLFYNWKVFVGTIISIFLSTIALATFSLLLINSIYYIVNAKALHAQNPEMPIAIFGTLIGISFFLGLFCIHNTLSLSIKVRWKFFVKLRIIGLTFRKIKLIILIENLIISGICIIISLFAGVGLANLVIDYFKSSNSIDQTFKIFNYFNYQWIYVLSTIAFVLTISFLAVTPLRKINIKADQDPFKKEKLKKIIIKSTFGLNALAGAIALSLIKPIQLGGMGIGMITCSIFLYIIAFGLIGQYFIKFIISFFELLTRKSIYFKMIFKYIKSNVYKIMLPIGLLIFNNFLLFFGTNTYNLINQKMNSTSFEAIIVLLVEIILFTVFVAGNAIIQYMIYQKNDIRKTKLLGMSNSQFYWSIIIQSLIISLITTLFTLPCNLFFNGMYAYFNNAGVILSNNVLATVLINVSMAVFSFIFSFISLLIIAKSNKKSYLK